MLPISIPELALRGVIPDVVTDQTPAHDVLMYVPSGLNVQRRGGAAPLQIRENMSAVQWSRWRSTWKPCWIPAARS